MAEIQLTQSQSAAVHDRGGALLVSAAAGSGKTKVLVDRLMSRVCDEEAPASLDEFLIITYTNAAAAELRGKIAAELGKRLALQPENRHLQRQLTRLYLTQISTVHAFCASILRVYAHLLDIPADFRVAEEEESRALRQQVFDELLEEKYGRISEDENFRAMIDQLGYGRDDRRLASVVLPAYDQILCRVDPGAWMKKCREVCCPAADTAAEQTIWGAFLMKTLRRTLLAAEENLTDALERMERDETLCGKYQKLFQDNLQSVRDLLQKTSWDDVCRSLIVSFGTLPPVRKECDADLQEKLKNIRKTALQDIRSVQAYFYADSAQVIADLRAASGPVFGLLDFVDAFDKVYQREKRRKKIFDFSDLEHQAIRLLTDRGTGRPTAAAQEIAQKYREILVDEYQDSNAVQEWIFQSVSHGGENLFLVGDVKQSIYRFRLAEPEIFLEKYARYAPQEKAVPGQPRKILLSENFRSRPEILEAVNDVFRLVMSPEAGDLAYGEEEALKPGRAFPPVPQSRVELHCIDLDVQTGDDEASPEKSRYEAAFVAQRIDRLLRDKTPVTDGETTRPARPGDIVILMRSPGRTASFYTEALAHYHIPSISDRGGSILETTEVQVLSAILAILDNPHQDIPLITAMASQVFGFSPDELAGPRSETRQGDYYDCLLNFSQKSEKQNAFLSWLNEAREEAARHTLTETIDDVLNRTGLADVYTSMPDGQQRRRNLNAYRELAAAYDASGGRTLMDWNDYLAKLKEDGTAVSIKETTRTADAVSIMSIHKSKGLEFPIVLLADLSRKMNLQDNAASVLLDNELMIGSNVVDTKNKVYYPGIARAAIAEKKTRETVSEEMRVLYVAMTRAKEMLIMTYCSGFLKAALRRWNEAVSEPVRPEVSGAARSPGDWILMAALCRTEAGELFSVTGPNGVSRVRENPWIIRLHSAEEIGLERKETVPVQPEVVPELAPESVARELSYHYAHPEAAEVPSKLTATQLKGRILDYEAAEAAEAPVSREPISWHRPELLPEKPLTGREKGNATHLFMQFVRYEACTSSAGIEGELSRLQEKKFLTKQQADAVNRDWILDLFRGEFGRRILAASRVQREFKFSLLTDAAPYYPRAAGEQVLLQGVVDCFWQETDGIVLVDFKTDRLSGSAEEKILRYTPQLRAYAGALARIFEKPVKEAWLYFFDAARAVKI